LQLIAEGHTNVNPSPRMTAAVDALIASNTNTQMAADTFRLGQGTWEVFDAPHIRTLSALMFTEFEPIRYVLDGEFMSSNVKYKLPIGGGDGWLSASGSLTALGRDSLTLHFDRFWVDRGSTPLRPIISQRQADKGWDGFITNIGRLTFFDNLATFPVLYVDEELTVFKFPPLNVKIAARRV